MSTLSQSKEYINFRGTIPLKKICVENSKGESWKIFDTGPRTVRCPLIFLPPACGTADIYFRQLIELRKNGYRVIAVESPGCYWTVTDWCIGFKLLLDYLQVVKVHLFGASLGGFLAQKFVEFTYNKPIVVSLILCNTFTDTSIFDFTEASSFFWMLPLMLLRRLILPSLLTNSRDPDIRKAVEFVFEKSKNLKRLDLASRLTINCVSNHVCLSRMRGLSAVTIMDVFDEYALSTPVREEIYDAYPEAKLAHLKSGGNFPYVSKYEEVNLHVKIHLRTFRNTPLNPQESEFYNTSSLIGTLEYNS